MGYPHDTNEALTEARKALSAVINGNMFAEGDGVMVRKLAEAFETLDGALSTGEQLPDAWCIRKLEYVDGVFVAPILRLVDAWARWRIQQSDWPAGASREELALLAVGSGDPVGAQINAAVQDIVDRRFGKADK